MAGNSPIPSQPKVQSPSFFGRWRRLVWFVCAATLVYSLLSSYHVVYQLGWHLGRVKGQVTLDGQPVADAKLLFVPIDSYQSDELINPVSVARTDKNGWFWLKTIDGRKGAVVGRHLVYVSTKDVTVSTDGQDRESVNRKELIRGPSGDQSPRLVGINWFGRNQLQLDFSSK